jgi:uncharacterized protein (TIGR03083 family)
VTGRALIDHDRLLDVLRTEGELMAGVAENARHDLPVRSRPGSSLGETVRHLGGVYRMVVARLRGGTVPVHWRGEPPPGGALVEFLLGGLHEMVDELAAHPADEICQTWWPLDQTYGFWRRRMAHETVVHRVDVQDAVRSELGAIDDELAVDGIDEALTLWFAHRLSVIGVTGSARFRVAVNSGGRFWLASSGGRGTAAWRAARADVADVEATVEGDPMTVYLWLWGRSPITAVRVVGDSDAVGHLWALLRMAI